MSRKLGKWFTGIWIMLNLVSCMPKFEKYVTIDNKREKVDFCYVEDGDLYVRRGKSSIKYANCSKCTCEAVKVN